MDKNPIYTNLPHTLDEEKAEFDFNVVFGGKWRIWQFDETVGLLRGAQCDPNLYLIPTLHRGVVGGGVSPLIIWNILVCINNMHNIVLTPLMGLK